MSHPPYSFEDLLKVGSDALYRHLIETARREIDEVEFELADMARFVRRMSSESDITKVLLIFTYFDDRFTELFSKNFLNLNDARTKSSLFGINAPPRHI